MSWLVETLLLSRHEILVEHDFESDEYNNLLLIEKKIEELVRIGTIDMFELAILNYVSQKKSYSMLQDLLGISRNNIANHFKKICKRISYSLGGMFTDEGFIEYMRETHNLTNKEVERMRNHMTGKYRHAIRRKSHE
jgi:hypothetical protein